jgi:TolB protein
LTRRRPPGAVLAAAASLALLAGPAACRAPTETEKQRVRSSIGAAPLGPTVAWELVYEQTVDGNTDLYAVSSAAGEPRRLTRDPAEDTLPRFTPDGTSVVYSSKKSGSWQVWRMPAAGGEARRIRANGATEYQADVSPDGARLAFLTDLGGPERLVVMELETGAVRDLVRHGRRTIFGNPHWSPDGSRIAFSSNWKVGHQIYVVEVASAEARRISPLTSGGCEPRFSRDGRHVVYVSRGHMGSTSRLVEHDLATGEERALVDWPALNYDPVYSPDGRELAFASNITGEFAIYRQRLSDGKAWRVTFGAGPARSPDYRPAR